MARARISASGLPEADFAILSAISPSSMRLLQKDYGTLLYLWKNRACKFVPRPYFICSRKIGLESSFLDITISGMEWLKGYFEWHFSPIAPEKGFGIMTWQPGNGIVPLPEGFLEERLFELASTVLAYYFDPLGLRQICLFSNAAGDFVASLDRQGHLCVKLTTVRQYKNIMGADSGFHKMEGLLHALLYLFLDLVLNMRLDRLCGTGPYFFADARFIRPIIRGFFFGLYALGKESTVPLPLKELFYLIQGFTADELLSLYEPLMHLYREWKRADVKFLEKNIQRHCWELSNVLESTPFPSASVSSTGLAA